MAGYKRPRCKTETAADVADTTNGSMRAKKPKSASDEAGSLRRPRPPKKPAEEQELNRLDQKEYDEIIKRLSYIPGIENHEFLARKEFWEKFYARTGDTFSESGEEKMNSRAHNIVAERRKSRPWYIWGLDGYNREQFPEGWPHLYEDGEEEGASQDIPPSVPLVQAQATSADSNRKSVIVDKTGSYGLPLIELEKAVEDNEKEISALISLQDQKMAESEEIRIEAIQLKAGAAEGKRMAAYNNAKAVPWSENAAKLDKQADKLDVEVATSKNTLKQKQPLLEVQKLVLAARRAIDNYDNQ
ncbi:hypothetical protein VE02_05433 [Pseudogymnoascus sp. 03VT05]|nr:hypothetical protein VE02_05433 [Pseudogymnoascus sp. 03VT05]